jgi:hypothetical protein
LSRAQQLARALQAAGPICGENLCGGLVSAQF